MSRMFWNSTICCDMDGVLADFEGSFRERFGSNNRHLVSLHARYPEVEKEIIDEFCTDPDTYANLIPFFGGAVLTARAQLSRNKVIILTSRPEHLKEVTISWLKKYGIQYDQCVFAKDKPQFIQQYNELHPNRPISCLIDDVVSNFINLEIPAIAWAQPWNSWWYPRATYNNEWMEIVYSSKMGDDWEILFGDKNDRR